jgi:hypothetical protein
MVDAEIHEGALMRRERIAGQKLTAIRPLFD